MNATAARMPSSAGRVSRGLSALAAVYVIVGGLLSFLGWALDVNRLIDWWGTGVTIKANAAIAFMAAGAALLGSVLWPTARVAIRACAIFAAALGGLTLLQHVSGLNLGLDTLLFDEPRGAAATAAPGRMGPPASLSFLLFGIAIVFLDGRARARALSAGLAIITLAIGTLSLTGYIYGAEAMYAVPRLTGIAVQTATMIIALSIGVIAAAPDHEPMKTLTEESTAGALARRVMPAAFLVPLLLGWVRLQGERAELYDEAFGSALRTLVEIAILSGMLWWTVRATRMRDIQERRAEAERHASERRLSMVLDASAVPFCVLAPVKDSAGAIVDFTWMYLNRSAGRLLERDPKDLIGRRVSVVLPGAWNTPGLFDAYVAVAMRQEIRELEIFFDASGIEGWFQVVASPLDDTVAVWFADVTERKRQELELLRADRRKDEFLATLAHELRNPLAPIRQASMLAKKTSLSDSQRQWCNDVIERQVQHMSLLLDDLLDVSRITRGTLELRKQPTALTALVDSAIETARPLIDSKKHTLQVQLPEEAVQLEVDPLRTAQIVSNLLNNAAKYTDAGGSIELLATIAERDFVLGVTDNGIGIPREEQGAIFRMFSQVKSAQERSEGGLGIGLALTRGLVELHGGTIKVASAGHGTGSTFTVRIPNAVVTPGANELHVSPTARPTLSRRILLADDNRDAAESLAMLLRSDGHLVALARDGEEALASFGTFDPDVALLDIGMPRMSGYEVAKRIRAQSTSVLLIAITGWGQSSDRAESAQAGFDHHLTKPVDYEVLAKLLVPDAHRPSLGRSEYA